jgi:hypothetical protein
MVTVTIPNDGRETSLNYSTRSSCKMDDFYLTGVPDWLDGSIEDNVINFTAERNDDTKERSVFLTPVINGKECKSKKIQIIQEGSDIPAPTCARGTDNGTDVINGVKYPHPMLICAVAYTDSDSTYVRDLKYNGVTLSSNWVTVDSWLQIRRDTDGSGSVCGYGWVHYKVTKNDTGSIRTATLNFSTSDSEVCEDSPIYEKYGIKNACQQWEVEVKQAPCGFYWCGNHSYTSQIIPCGSSCEYGSTGSSCNNDCDCSGGGGSFNVNGHSSNFTTNTNCDADEYSVTISDTATYTTNGDNISLKNHSQGDRLSAGSYSVVLGEISQDAQPTITFVHDSDSVTVTFNRTCEGTVCDCNSIDITASTITFDSTGGSKTIGTISDDCTLKLSSVPNWITVNQDGTNINVSVSNYEESSDRSESFSYGVDGVEGFCGSVSVTQRGKEGCKVVEGNVDILISGNVFSPQYVGFAITDSRNVDSSCADWIISEGERIYPGGEDYHIANYLYTSCEGSMDHTFQESLYNSCSSARVKDIEPGKTYYLHGEDMEGFHYLRTISMPNFNDANNGSVDNKYYIR